MKPSTLINLLGWRASNQPDQLAYSFLTDGEAEKLDITYQALDRQSRALGAWLQSEGATGERVLLLYPPGLDFITAFFGCLYGGAIAVPAYPPDPARLSRTLSRLRAIVKDARPLVVLTTSQILATVERLAYEHPDLKKLRWLSTSHIESDLAGQWRVPKADPQTPAFLQYTSGSTSAPKGVIVTHGNLIHNERMIQQACGHTEESTFVGWLPLYHDMGLIGNVLQPLYIGSRCVLMSPMAFLEQPFRWLQAVSRYRAATSGGPNFAYDLCVRKITAEQRATLDLSSWTTAFNGAEPVRYETMERFAATFAESGFRREVFYPCYGLAEATLLVTGGLRLTRPVVQAVDAVALEHNRVAEASAGTRNARTLVSCGRTHLDQNVVIVDTESFTPCPPDQVGEIWVSGPSVAQGYWKRDDETEQTFHAYLAGDREGPFLRTGDVGFITNGELFVTGRLKDLIIIRGRNHYPQDIELTVERSHAALRPGCGAAFSIDHNDEERLVIVQEVDPRKRPDADAVSEAIRQEIAEHHELQALAVVLIKPGTIPKTSSGKIQRQACKAEFLAGSLDVFDEWREPSREEIEPSQAGQAVTLQTVEDIQAWLTSQLAERLKVDAGKIEPDKPISRFGLDSLAAVELSHEVQAILNVNLPATSFLSDHSIAQLAAMARSASFASAPATRQDQKETMNEPLSYGQRALWFLHQLAPESPAYNIASAVRIRAELDVAALNQAFQVIVDRHPALRTTFTSANGEPAQKVHERMDVCFLFEDATNWAEARLNDRLVEETHRPFDLEQGPLLKVFLFSRSPEEHVALLIVHHIVADFWSLGVLIYELGALYQAAKEGSAANLIAPETTYKDFSRRQAEMLDGPEGERLWSYWQSRLSGELSPLDLPTDHHQPPVQTYSGASCAFKLTAELAEKLKALSQSENSTLYMTLLSAFNVLIHRYTGQDDLLVGTPTAGRNRREMRGVVGYFVNPVVIRTSITSGLSFTQLLAQVRKSVLEALDHQELPFALLVERLQPLRDPSRSPLFQTMFILQRAHQLDEEGLAAFALSEAGAHIDLGQLRLESISLERRVAQFDLTLSMVETEDGLSASIEYNRDMFEEQSVNRLALHFITLLEAIVSDPSAHISRLKLIPDDHLHQLLVAFNHTRATYPSALLLHDLFQRQASLTPQAEALVFADHRFTYQQLNEQANQLAHFLSSRGVGPESLVAICINRSPQMLVALLGVLKAGAGYVPVDPNYPPQRIHWMMDDLRGGLVLSEANLADRLTGFGVEVICLDQLAQQLDEQSRENVEAKASERNTAYVIYTSGSTGRPKGVVIEHRSVVTFMHWVREHYSAQELSGVLAATSICFDLSVFELFGPLSWGGKVLLVEDALSVGEMSASARREVRLINTVPSAIREIVRVKAMPEGVVTVNLAGEALRRVVVDEVYGQAGIQRVVNLYGPSEDTTYTTIEEVEREEQREPTIGRPVAETRLYVLDGEQEIVAVGVIGELYVGGGGLARGYLERAEQTAERFVPDRWSEEEGGRLYRTGDVVRRLGDGRIEYLGRRDGQVKVRGYRIELGEIEAAMSGVEGVKSCVVMVRESEGGDKRLVGYVEVEEGREVMREEVMREMRRRVPEYMVPGEMVMMREMPQTPNGKVDRGALERMREEAGAGAGGREGEGGGKERARNRIEEELVEIWEEVLGGGEVGVRDKFFEIGGHSLLATQVVSRVRERMGVEVGLRSLFESPTIAEMAEIIEANRAAKAQSQTSAIKRVSRDGHLLPSFAQERLWFLDQLDSGKAIYNMSAAVQIKGKLDAAALGLCLSEMVRRHESLRTIFITKAGQPVQVIAPAQAFALPLLDLSELSYPQQQSEARRIAVVEARFPFDLASGPLLRAVLLRTSDEDHTLVVTIHHIISDGWSIGVFFREVASLYKAFTEGSRSPLPDLPIQYADFAAWQREWMQGEALEKELSYWKQQLSGALPILELPSDRPRPPIQTFRGATVPLALTRELTESLKELSSREGATLYITLLAAFETLLYRYTGQEDITVGTPIAGRTRQEIENLLGFFVNTLVLRTDFSGRPSFQELLARVREVALGAFAHQELPFEKLVEALQPERSLSHTPLFQVMFGLQNAPAHELEIPGLTFQLLSNDSGTAKFDLTLLMEETEEGLVGTLQYNRDMFEEQSVNRLALHFITLLEAIVSDPSAHISRLKLIPDDHLHQLLVAFNHTRATYPSALLLHDLFQRQASLTPQAEALVFADHRFTYQQLNEQANQLAHFLSSRGVGPESLVAICINRSPQMLVALLGVLKAGAGYVPVDPNYPPQRIHWMMDDLRGGLVLSEANLADRLTGFGVEVICLDQQAELINQQSRENVESSASERNTAYVIYTSGSTGRPKGVVIEHRSVVTFMHWVREHYSAQELSGVLAATSICFDLSVFELFGPLSWGGKVLLVEDALSVGEMSASARREVRLINTVPSAIREIVRVKAMPEGVVTVNLAGEALRRVVVDEVYGQAGIQRVVNLYGPSEDTTYTTIEEVEREEQREPTIGRPVAETRLYVLDGEQEIVAVGVIGELYVGGGGLARGYLERAEQTAERFVPDRWSEEEGGRLYRTGDVVRRLGDGRIEYLGRRDGQVKVRGYRIELGEIEAAMSGVEGVKSCVVMVRESEGGDKRLVGYVEVEEGREVMREEVMREMRRRVPEYMVPGEMVMMREMPQTPNGKVDRGALERMREEAGAGAGGREGEGGGKERARNRIEEELVEIWEEVLGGGEVGVRDKFFEIGGHSLLATQVVSRVRERMGVEVGLRSLFESPTIAEMAVAILQHQADQMDSAEIDQVLADLDHLSEDEALILLSEEMGRTVESNE